jgi:hypothetical protein
MTAKPEELQQVYWGLGQILQRPQAFGLGPSVPRPLADSLEAMLGTLGRAMTDEATPGEDLAAELSQDADQLISADR